MFQFGELSTWVLWDRFARSRPDAAGQVLYFKAGLLQELGCLLAAAAHLAMGDDLPLAIQLPNPLLQIAQGNQIPTDLRDLEFMRFADIEQEVILCPRPAAA